MMAASIQKGIEGVRPVEPSVDWNLAEADYARDFGSLSVNDPGLDAAGISLLKEGRAKDVPCRFHDGVSKICWKEITCPYGHDLYTGGIFAKRHPEAAMAASARRLATSVSNLSHKPILGRESQFFCRVTHVISPSEFFIEATNGTKCFCQHAEEAFLKEEIKDAEEAKKGDPFNYQLEAYDYGFNCLEEPELSYDVPDPTMTSTLTPIGTAQLLHKYLKNGFIYRNYQAPAYIPFVELAAVRIDGQWMRALVLCCNVGDNTELGAQLVRVQLLDTGKKITVSAKDVCRLPERFGRTPASAFRCCLFGISPVYFIWNEAAVKLFKELVENQEILVSVKMSIPKDRSLLVFESRPYVVKLLVKIGDVYIDVAKKLLEKGYGLQWNPFPFRPFARNKIEPSGLDAVYQPDHKPLPADALELENVRLQNDGYDYKLRKEGYEEMENCDLRYAR